MPAKKPRLLVESASLRRTSPARVVVTSSLPAPSTTLAPASLPARSTTSATAAPSSLTLLVRRRANHCYPPSTTPPSRSFCLSTTAQPAAVVPQHASLASRRATPEQPRIPLLRRGAGAGGDASAEGSTAGSCTNSADQTILAPGIGQAPTECATSCFGNPDTNCNSACIAKSTHLSPACSSCWGALLNCNVASCLAQCLSGQSDACTQCGAQNCQPAFKACSGS